MSPHNPISFVEKRKLEREREYLKFLVFPETLEELKEREARIKPFMAPYKTAKFAYLTLSDPHFREQYDRGNNYWKGIRYGAYVKQKITDDDPVGAPSLTSGAAGGFFGAVAGAGIGLAVAFISVEGFSPYNPAAGGLWPLFFLGAGWFGGGFLGEYAGRLGGEKAGEAIDQSRSCVQIFRQDTDLI